MLSYHPSMYHEALVNYFHPSLSYFIPLNVELFVVLFLYPLLIAIFLFVIKNLLGLAKFLLIENKKGIKAGRINTVFYLYSIFFVVLLGLGILLFFRTPFNINPLFGSIYPETVSAQNLAPEVLKKYDFGLLGTNYHLVRSSIFSLSFTLLLAYTLIFNYCSHLFLIIQIIKGRFNSYTKIVKQKFYIIIAISILSIPTLLVLIPNAYLHRNAFDPKLTFVCLNSPNSIGCLACKESAILINDRSEGNKTGSKQDLCQFCNNQIRQLSSLYSSESVYLDLIDPMCK